MENTPSLSHNTEVNNLHFQPNSQLDAHSALAFATSPSRLNLMNGPNQFDRSQTTVQEGSMVTSERIYIWYLLI